MMQPLLDRSGSGPYASIAKPVAEATKAMYEGGEGSPPSVIADAIREAIRAKKPKTRYAAGKLARPILVMRKWFPDRIFDKAIMNEVSKRQRSGIS